MLSGHSILPWRSSLDSDEKCKHDKLNAPLKERFELRIALLHGEDLIGWSYGWQDSVHVGDFYMAASLVLPEHRKRGLYTRMVQKVLEITRNEGFSAVRSRHLCTNNTVLIAKLKLGFIINGFEQDETMGTSVRTIYHHVDLRKKATYFRAGKIDEPSVLESLRLAKTF